MERIFKAVICGSQHTMLYGKLDGDGKKNFFAVKTDQPDRVGGHKITANEFEQQIEKHGHIVFLVEGQTKHRALMIEGIDIPWEPLFSLFIFEKKVDTIFQTIVSLNNQIDHYQLVELEKSFYSNPGLLVAIHNKLAVWFEDNSLSAEVENKLKKICNEHGYIKLLRLIESHPIKKAV